VVFQTELRGSCPNSATSNGGGIERFVLISSQAAAGRTPQRLFYLRLPRGTYTLRVFMSYNQVGAGYLDGFSSTRTYKRR